MNSNYFNPNMAAGFYNPNMNAGFYPPNMTYSSGNAVTRIVMVGKTGIGKSATGNTILGWRCFDSKFRAQSVTVDCAKGDGAVDGQPVAVIDTPGLFDTRFGQDKTAKDVCQCISYAAPGPHVFLVVIRLGRYTEEEKQTVQRIQEIFGQAADRYSMVLFTGGDLLEGDTIEEFMAGSPELQQLVARCNDQYHVFNNKQPDRTQVTVLLQKIREIVQKNGGSHYTNEMFQEAERAIEEEKQRILKEKEEKIRKEREEIERQIQQKFEKDMRKMQEQFQAERERERKALEEDRRREREELNEERRREMQMMREERMKDREELNEERRREMQMMREERMREREELNEERRREMQMMREEMVRAMERIDREIQMMREERMRKREENDREMQNKMEKLNEQHKKEVSEERSRLEQRHERESPEEKLRSLIHCFLT